MLQEAHRKSNLHDWNLLFGAFLQNKALAGHLRRDIEFHQVEHCRRHIGEYAATPEPHSLFCDDEGNGVGRVGRVRLAGRGVKHNLDVSVIDEMPAGRSPIVTKLYFESKRREAYQFIESELKKGRQAYVVYPLVEESEDSDLRAATEMAERLQRETFPERRVGLLHGRLGFSDKERVMRDFKDEVPGYTQNDAIIARLSNLTLTAGRGAVTDNLVKCYEALTAAGFFPTDELPLVRAWAEDVQAATVAPAARAA